MRDYADIEQPTLRLFEGFGIELEYMIVDADTLSVLPVTDEVLKSFAGSYVSDVEEGEIAWSNELVLHVIELKTNGPASSLEPLPDLFQRDLARIATALEDLGGRLMPTGMHPWMDPATETQLWPHEYSPVYESFNRIFGCQGHGWSNLQSMHINLPFADDEEFGRLHAAIRLVLPLLPALAASSPVVEGRIQPILDSRLEFYRKNARRVPSVSGQVIPEPAYTRAAYETDVLEPMYRDIAPHDPDGILRYEWLNARGTIARFDRMALEIRVLDMQECPRADLAIAALTTAAVRALVDNTWASYESQKRWPVDRLARIFRSVLQDAEHARIHDHEYLEAFGLADNRDHTAQEVWQHLADNLVFGTPVEAVWRPPLEIILGRGSLARRIVHALDGDSSRDGLIDVYRRLCDCLEAGTMFE